MKKWLVGIAVVLLTLGIVGYFVYDYFTHLGDPISIETQEAQRFEVVSGSSFKAVVNNLEQKGLIRSATYAQYLNRSENFSLKAGEFEISPDMSTQEILSHLSNSQNIIEKVYRFTLIPGKRQNDYAKSIASHGFLREQEISEAWNDEAFLRPLIDKYSVLTDDILTDNLFSKLEGYLFPETYEVMQDATILQVTTKILDQMERYYVANKAAFDATELSIHEVMTLASIVQAEASRSDDMAKVGSVIYNRLADNIKLGMSVTVCYAKQIFDDWEECERTSFDSPYNTYQHAGIPIGPIGNASVPAIHGVIQPIETSYYYFIADVLGDNTMYFAETFSEHQANINKYLKRD